MLCSNDEDDERIYTYFLNKKKVTGRSIEEKENNRINWTKLWRKYSPCIYVILQSGE